MDYCVGYGTEFLIDRNENTTIKIIDLWPGRKYKSRAKIIYVIFGGIKIGRDYYVGSAKILMHKPTMVVCAHEGGTRLIEIINEA
jgi:hypothetical protein